MINIIVAKRMIRREVFLVFLLFTINFFLTLPLFREGYPSYFSSIEPVYPAQVKFLQKDFSHWEWNPYWYLGLPTRFSGSPLFILLLFLASKITPTLSLFCVYRIVTSLALSLTTITFYLFVKLLCRDKTIAFFSVLFYSLCPSLAYLLPNLFPLAQKLSFPPSQILVLIYFGSGPKIVGLLLLPLSLILFVKLIRNFSGSNLSLATICSTLILLTDTTVSFSLVLLFIVILLSSLLLGKTVKKFRISLIFGITTWCLSAFWFSPAYIHNLLVSPSLGGFPFQILLKQLFSILIIAIPIILALFTRRFAKLEKNQPWIILALWLVLFIFLTSLFYLENPEFKSEYVRFLPEIDMGIAILLTLLAKHCCERWGKIVWSSAIVFIILLSCPFIFSRNRLLSPLPQISHRPEYQIAKWLEENVSDKRIYATGSTAFWLNSLADIQQVRGGSDFSSTHPWWKHASFQIREGKDGELARSWLEALGTSYVVVHSQSSAEFYHDYKHPEKFKDVLPEVYSNNQGDLIYEVNQENTLARIVEIETVNKLKVPKDGADKINVAAYALWRTGPESNQTDFIWINNQEATIKSKLSKDQALSLAITYDPGWKAFLLNKNLPIQKDILGQILIIPKEEGEIKIQFKYQTPWIRKIGYPLTLITGIFLLSFSKFRKKLEAWQPSFLKFKEKDEEIDY